MTNVSKKMRGGSISRMPSTSQINYCKESKWGVNEVIKIKLKLWEWTYNLKNTLKKLRLVKVAQLQSNRHGKLSTWERYQMPIHLTQFLMLNTLLHPKLHERFFRVDLCSRTTTVPYVVILGSLLILRYSLKLLITQNLS